MWAAPSPTWCWWTPAAASTCSRCPRCPPTRAAGCSTSWSRPPDPSGRASKTCWRIARCSCTAPPSPPTPCWRAAARGSGCSSPAASATSSKRGAASGRTPSTTAPRTRRCWCHATCACRSAGASTPGASRSSRSTRPISTPRSRRSGPREWSRSRSACCTASRTAPTSAVAPRCCAGGAVPDPAIRGQAPDPATRGQASSGCRSPTRWCRSSASTSAAPPPWSTHTSAPRWCATCTPSTNGCARWASGRSCWCCNRTDGRSRSGRWRGVR